MLISNNKTYDVLKFIALVLLPALGTFYLGLGQIFHIPKTDEVVATVVLLDTFLGTVLQFSSVKYNRQDHEPEIAGYLGGTGVDPDTGLPDIRLTITKDPREVVRGEYARLKIGTPPPPQ